MCYRIPVTHKTKVCSDWTSVVVIESSIQVWQRNKHCSSLCDHGLENVTAVPADMSTNNERVVFHLWILDTQVGTGVTLRQKAWCWTSPTRKYEEERRGGGLLCGHMLHNQNVAAGRKREREKKKICRNESQEHAGKSPRLHRLH